MVSGQVAAIVLAAGESRRWGRDNKLLAPIDGTAMIVRTVGAVLASKARPVIVVTGHEADAVTVLLAGRPLSFVAAPDFAEGLSASLKAGIAAVPAECAGALVCLGDMPWISPATFDRLAEAFAPTGAKCALVPTYRGEWGNPVLLGRALFPDIGRLSGDRGARTLLSANPERVGEVSVDDPGVLHDVDQPSALVYPLTDGIGDSQL